MPDFTIRKVLPEIMDEPGLPENEIRLALNDVDGINALLGGYALTISALKKLQPGKGPFTLIDVGCGSGNMLRIIARWAQKSNKPVTLTGVDWNPQMTGYAAEKSEGFKNIGFETVSVFDDKLMELQADYIACCLFCHHFEKGELVKLIKRMYRLAGKAVIINDLHRTRFAYHAIAVLTRLFSKSYMVKYDAPLSVANAFKKRELHELLQLAGISNYTLKWRWAWRWELILYK